MENNGAFKRRVQFVRPQPIVTAPSEEDDPEPPRQQKRGRQEVVKVLQKRQQKPRIEEPEHESPARQRRRMQIEELESEKEEPIALEKGSASEETDLGYLCQRFLRAANDQTEIRALLGQNGLRQLGFFNIPPPDPSDADGTELLKNPKALAECLCASNASLGYIGEGMPANDNVVIEKLGVLLQWWGVARKAFAIVAILEALRKRNRRRGSKGIEERYAKVIEGLPEEARPCGFRQAQKYEKLGKFLARFPQFLHQTEFTTLHDWTNVLLAEQEKAMTVLEAFVKQYPSV